MQKKNKRLGRWVWKSYVDLSRMNECLMNGDGLKSRMEFRYSRYRTKGSHTEVLSSSFDNFIRFPIRKLSSMQEFKNVFCWNFFYSLFFVFNVLRLVGIQRVFFCLIYVVFIFSLISHDAYGVDDGRPPAEFHVCSLLTSLVILRIRFSRGRLSMLPGFVGCNCVDVLSPYSIELETSSANESKRCS